MFIFDLFDYIAGIKSRIKSFNNAMILLATLLFYPPWITSQLCIRDIHPHMKMFSKKRVIRGWADVVCAKLYFAKATIDSKSQNYYKDFWES